MIPFKSFFGSSLSNKIKKEPESKTFDFDRDPSSEEISQFAAGLLTYAFDLVKVPEDEVNLIKTYRELAKNSEVELALNEIQNEVFIFDVPGKKAFELDFNQDSKISDSIRKKIIEEFDFTYGLLDFKNRGLEYFMNWYIDGRLFLHKVYDDNRRKGIKKIIQIDPIKIKKIKEYPDPDKDGLYDVSKIREYYVYSDAHEQPRTVEVTKIQRNLQVHPDAITFIDCGVYDRTINKVTGFLHKTIIPYNNLKLLEDSVIIYRVSRAPERRIFYVDVGNLPKSKAEQYIQTLMSKFKNKLVYNSKTGSILDKKSVLSMVEDYWLPRRDGKGTEVSTLQGGQLTGELEDLNHFKVKFWQSLNVPMNRFTEQAPSFMFGKGPEIYREEYRFKKFIDKVRNRFMNAIEDVLRSQLILKNIISTDDWNAIKNDIQWVFTEDNNFVEYKEAEVMGERFDSLQRVENYIGTFYSREWIMRNVLKFTDDDIKIMKEQIANEKKEFGDNDAEQDNGNNNW